MDFLTFAQMREAVASLKVARDEETFQTRCLAIVAGRGIRACHWCFPAIYYGELFTIH